jgi:hypothetical protein
VVLIALACPSLAGATSATAVSTRQVPAKGGAVTWKTTVKHSGWCVWSSSPKVPKFNTSVKCKAGTVSRSATVPKNLSTKSNDYTLTLKLVAKTSTVQRLSVVEAGAVVNLGVHLDPSLTQDPTNPLEVTWYYSASADFQLGTAQQSDPSLPAGVLSLYSNGLLVQSVNVGGSVTSDYATTTYSSTGPVTIDVIYDSGSNTATTGDETYDIEPVDINVSPPDLVFVCATYYPAPLYFPNSGAVFFNYELSWQAPIPASSVGAVSMSTPVGGAIVSNSEQLMDDPPTGDFPVTISFSAGSETVGGFAYIWSDFTDTVTMGSAPRTFFEGVLQWWVGSDPQGCVGA